MRIKVDECLNELVASSLRAAGHDAVTVHDQRLAGSADPDLLAVCTGEGRAMITRDKEYADLLTYPPATHAGVILLRVPDSDGIELALKLVDWLGPRLPADGIAHEVWVVTPGRVRIVRDESTQ